VIDHWRWLAAHYERLIRPPAVELWRRALRLPAAGWLVDVAGGTGRVSTALAGSVGGVVVIDLSPDMLSQAAGRPGMTAIRAAAEQLPLHDASCPRLLLVDALHHVADTPAVMAELCRALAPGGRLVIEEPDWHRPTMRLIGWVERAALMRSHPEAPERIMALAQQEGCRARCLHAGPLSVWVLVTKPASAGRVRGRGEGGPAA
jgi:demethylmenaquinone methyltransferase/2-methoxy-6-polyprenyl-1,4-benzoquinol methylase